MPSGVYFRTEKNKRNLSLWKKGCIPWNKGKEGVQKHSEETKRKMRNRIVSLETREIAEAEHARAKEMLDHWQCIIDCMDEKGIRCKEDMAE